MDNIVQFDRNKLEKELKRSKAQTEFEKIEPRLKKLPQYRGSVPSKNFLSKDPHIKVGQCYWIENEGSLFTVAEKTKKGVRLTSLDMNATVSTGYTIYEMNQAMTAKEPLADLGDWPNGEFSDYLSDVEDDVTTFFEETANKVYLMYGRDLHYFTVFTMSDEPHYCFVEEILSCLVHTWDIVSIDVDMSEDDGMPKIEIWVRDRMQPGAKENALANHMLYLMPFDGNVVEL